MVIFIIEEWISYFSAICAKNILREYEKILIVIYERTCR